MNLFKQELIQTADKVFEVKGLQSGDYDKQAIQYDKLISNGLYNRIMWGNTRKDYATFSKKGIESNNKGIITDIGCGTLSFTYKVYANHCQKPLYLCDLSSEMLKIGRQRIEKACNNINSFTFLRSDALNMPFKDNTVETILNFGIFHIFDQPDQLIQEMARILQPKGKIFLTSLCTDRKFSAKYLNILHKKGHVAKPLPSSEIKKIIKENDITITDFKVKGGMVYIAGVKS